MKKLTTEQLEKLKAATHTLYQLEDELSSDFEGNHQDAKDVYSLLMAASQLTILYEKWKENR